MTKYRKKPVVIEAVQFLESDSLEDLQFQTISDDIPEWLLKALDSKEIVPYYPDPSGWGICDVGIGLNIKTLEGDHLAMPGDYIIQGIKGELYPCKPDIFEQTYEEVKTC